MVDDPHVGLVLDGRYRVVERLAMGGMGAVYRGERLKLGREVAVKFLHAWAAADESFIKRFEVEARAMARLQHPNCASVIDFGVEAHEPYVVMDLVGGVSLRLLLDDGALPPVRAIDIARQALAGLSHAHRQGITHRDVKPENIMVEAGELGDQVRVLDFGLAKMAHSSGDLTGEMLVGTPGYMSPEQCAGDPVDARTDVYAMGIVLFEMLTGDKPFLADEGAEILRMHRTAPRPRLADRRSDLAFSPELEALVARALAVAAGDRYASAAELARALDGVPEAPLSRGATPPPRPAPEDPPTFPDPPRRFAPSGAPVAVRGGGAAWPAVQRWLAVPRVRWAVIGGLGAVLVIAVIALVVVSGGGGKRAPAPAVDDRAPAPEIEMPVDELPNTPPELVSLRDKVHGGSTSDGVMRALQRLGQQHPANTEIPLLLGQVYFARLWVDDGLEQFRKAIKLDPSLRGDPRLIQSALNGLGNDNHHAEVRRFLAREIGDDAVPFLEGVVSGNWRREVKERAAATLRDLGQ